MERILAADIQRFFTPAENLNSIKSVTDIIVQNAFTLAGIIAFVLLIFGGFQFIVSAGSGDTKKMEGAKKSISSAFLGLIIIFVSYWIVQIVETLTGVKIISPP